MNEIVEIVLLRHGRSRADDEGVHEGRYDSPLTETGYTQARARAEDFLARNWSFDLVICSTLQRARETARILAEMLNLPVETDPDWMEFDAGPLAGLTFAEAERLYPMPDFRNPFQPVQQTGESAWESYRRAIRALERIVRRGAGRYLVVSHGGTINDALRAIFGATPRANHQRFSVILGDLAFVRLRYHPSLDRWDLLEFDPGFGVQA